MNDSIHTDFAYLGEVLQSALSDSAKLFFAGVLCRSAFRDYWGISHPEWSTDPQIIAAIESLEADGFLDVCRENGDIDSIAHRIWIGRNRGQLI